MSGSWQAFWFRGPDAEDFLHRLTSAQVRGLESGHGTPAALLTAAGKIRAFFYLWRFSAEEFLIECDGGQAESLKAALEELHFAENFTVEDFLGAPSFLFGDKASGAAFTAERDASGSLRLRRSTREYGTPWLAEWVPGRQHPDTEALEHRESDRIRALSPRVGREITSDTNPLELGLFTAVADQKGCYPGQEVLEKILSLGEPARRLALLRAAGPISVGDSVREGTAEVGKVTSTATDGTATIALALLRKTAAQPQKSLTVGGNGLAANVERVAPYSATPEETP